MTALIVIVLWVIALFVVLLLVGGIRRGDELLERSLRSMRNPSREPAEPTRSERFSPPWSKPPKKPGRAAADTRGRSLAHS
jgi:hypothetical protein